MITRRTVPPPPPPEERNTRRRRSPWYRCAERWVAFLAAVAVAAVTGRLTTQAVEAAFQPARPAHRQYQYCHSSFSFVAVSSLSSLSPPPSSPLSLVPFKRNRGHWLHAHPDHHHHQQQPSSSSSAKAPWGDWTQRAGESSWDHLQRLGRAAAEWETNHDEAPDRHVPPPTPKNKGYQRVEEWEQEQQQQQQQQQRSSWEERVQFEGQRHGNRLAQHDLLRRTLKLW